MVSTGVTNAVIMAITSRRHSARTDRDQRGTGRRRQWGSDRRTRAMAGDATAGQRHAGSRWRGSPSSSRWPRGWPTWSPGSSTTSSTRGTETAVARTEAVLYLLIVTLLTVSALAYLLSRLGFFYRTRTPPPGHPRRLDQFYDAAAADADHDHPVLPGGGAGHPDDPAVGRAAGVPGPARRAADRRPAEPDARRPGTQLDAARALPGKIEELLAEPRQPVRRRWTPSRRGATLSGEPDSPA